MYISKKIHMNLFLFFNIMAKKLYNSIFIFFSYKKLFLEILGISILYFYTFLELMSSVVYSLRTKKIRSTLMKFLKPIFKLLQMKRLELL